MCLPLWMVSAGEAPGIMPCCFGINLPSALSLPCKQRSINSSAPRTQVNVFLRLSFSPHFPSSALCLLLGRLFEQSSGRWGMLLWDSMSHGCGSPASAQASPDSQNRAGSVAAIFGVPEAQAVLKLDSSVLLVMLFLGLPSAFSSHWWFCSKPRVSNKLPTEPPKKLPSSANSICHGCV